MGDEPKFEQVKRLLRQRIRAEYPVGSKIPSTTKLHRELGLSPGTINRAIRDLVDEGLLERFTSRGTFVAQSRPDTRNIGFLWPSPFEEQGHITPYTTAILHAAEEEAHQLGKHITVGAMRNRTEPRFMGDGGKQVAGVVMLFNADPHIVEAYHDRGVPVVHIDPFVRTAGTPFVTSDHYAAAREATMHLLRLGHRRIVHVTMDFPMSCVQRGERVLGYEEAMREAGEQGSSHVHAIPLNQDLLMSKTRPFLSLSEAFEPNSVEPFIEMLDDVKPTACSCFDDGVAAWIISVCHDQGIRVPDELSVVGINDSGLATLVWPPLTSVRLPLADLGRAAVRLLNGLIEEGRLTGRGEVFPVHLVERASAVPLSRRGARTMTAKEVVG